MTPVKQFFNALLDTILPPLCHICHNFIPDAGPLHICQDCHEQLPLIHSPACSICAVPFSGTGYDHRCGKCITKPPHYDFARTPFLYEGAIREMIHAFKYDRRTHLARPLALLMLEQSADSLRQLQPDLIIPVPLHRSRLRERGFNQAVLLGKKLSCQLGVPLHIATLKRIRYTEPQIELSAAERQLNVKGAFSVIDPALVTGKRIVLLDDVMTTGSTLNECAKALKTAGADLVIATTVARAPK